MTKRQFVLKTVLVVALHTLSASARADVYVVVHANNPTSALTPREALSLFMGRSRAFSNGDFAMSLDMPRDSAARATFYRLLTGMSLSEVNSYWARLMFSGQTAPPQTVESEADMIKLLEHNPSAIGYITHEPTETGLKTVLVLKDSH